MPADLDDLARALDAQSRALDAHAHEDRQIGTRIAEGIDQLVVGQTARMRADKLRDARAATLEEEARQARKEAREETAKNWALARWLTPFALLALLVAIAAPQLLPVLLDSVLPGAAANVAAGP